MLYRLGTASAASVRHHTHVSALTGRKLGRLVRKSTTVADRVLLALRLEREGLGRLTRAQAARLANVSIGYVSTASRLSAEEQRQLALGSISLSQRHNRWRNSPTDDEIDRLVSRIGAGRFLAALDRATAPSNEDR